MDTPDSVKHPPTAVEVERAVARVKGGCLDDYATVVVAYHERLRAALAPWCPPGVDLGEMTHLVFIEAFRNLERFQPGTDFFAWLRAIGRFRLMTECERLRRQAINQRHYSEHALIGQLEVSIRQEGEPDEVRLGLLNQCLESLRPEALQLLKQRYAERLGVQEIADVLGRSASAVSVQLFALRRKLRDCVEAKLRALSHQRS